MKRLILFFLAVAILNGGCRKETLPRGEAPRPRIVSFSPNITEILFDMHLGEHVVGVTTYCKLPPGQKRRRVGSMFDVNTETILAAGPDIVLIQSSISRFRGLASVAPGIRIERLRIESLADIPEAMRRIGELVGRADLANEARDTFEAKLARIAEVARGKPRPRVLFAIGTDRPSVAAEGSFVHDLIIRAGGVNAAEAIPGRPRWRDATIESIHKAAPDVIICQVPRAERAAAAREYWMRWADLPAVKTGRVYVEHDPQWTIASGRMADVGLRLANLVHRSAGQDWPGRPAKYRPWTLWSARMWRLLAVAVVGAALAAAGMALQGLLRNPLAEPYILGISSGAGVGVLFGMAAASWLALGQWATTPVLAFLGSLATCAVVYGIAQRRGRLDSYTMILAGIIVNASNGAIMLTIYLYIDPYRIPDFARWSMGQVPEMVDLWTLGVCGALVLLGWGLLLFRGAHFNALALGDEVAASTGVSVHRLRIETFVTVALMTAAAVALVGPIGFVGLIVPHICRMIVGPDHRRLVLASGIGGAAFLMIAETLCRNIGPLIGVGKVPVGILCALCGGPFFIVLLRRGRSGGAA